MIKDFKNWSKWVLFGIALIGVAFFLPMWEIDYNTDDGSMIYEENAMIDGIDTYQNVFGQEGTEHIDYEDITVEEGEAPLLNDLTLILQLTVLTPIITGFAWAIIDEDNKARKWLAITTILSIITAFMGFWIIWDSYLDTQNMSFFFENGENIMVGDTEVSGNPSWGFFLLISSLIPLVYAMRNDINEVKELILNR